MRRSGKGSMCWAWTLGVLLPKARRRPGGRKSGRLEGFAVFPEHPNLATRAINDGAGNLYSECHRRGELLLAGDMVSDIGVLLSEALDRWGRPAAIAADRFKRELYT